MYVETIGTRVLRCADNPQEAINMDCYIANDTDILVDFVSFKETGEAITIVADEASVESAIKNLQMLLDKARTKKALREDGDHWLATDKA